MENLDQEKKIRREIEGSPYFEEIHRKNLEAAKRWLELTLGIEPTTTELIKMSHIVEDVIKQTRQQKKQRENRSGNTFSMVASFEEVPERVVNELYGVTLEEINKLFPRSEDKNKNEETKELKKKYFRRKQAELYN